MQKAKLAQFYTDWRNPASKWNMPCPHLLHPLVTMLLLSGCSNEVLLVQTIIAGRGWLGWCRLLGNLWTVASVKCLVRANVRTQDTQCTVGLSWDTLHTGNINSGVSSPFLSVGFSDFCRFCPYFELMLPKLFPKNDHHLPGVPQTRHAPEYLHGPHSHGCLQHVTPLCTGHSWSQVTVCTGSPSSASSVWNCSYCLLLELTTHNHTNLYE